VASVALLLALGLKLIKTRTAGNIISISTVLCPLLVSPLPYYTLAANWNLYPPYPKSTYLQQTDNTDKELASLEREANRLRNKFNSLAEFNNLNNPVAKDTKAAVAETLTFLNDMKERMEEQRLLIAKLRQDVVEERDKVVQLEDRYRLLQSLSESQGDAVAVEFIRATKREAQSSFLLGFLISFPVGIVSSLLASIIYRRFGDKTNAVLKSGLDE
jgi:septal ring factor EnvC (AmiA/AmiB activator)